MDSKITLNFFLLNELGDIGYGQNTIPCIKILPCDAICQNGGTPINETSCKCPGGLIGTKCEWISKK